MQTFILKIELKDKVNKAQEKNSEEKDIIDVKFHFSRESNNSEY
jgi:hypothetical protein